MDKEQVGVDAWLIVKDIFHGEGTSERLQNYEPDAGEAAIKGVFLTTQQRDDLIAESEARGAGIVSHKIMEERYTAGATDMEWQAATVMRTNRIPRSAAEVRNRIQRFRDQLEAITSGQSQAYTDKIRGEALEAARDYLREVAEHVSPEGGGNLLIQAGDAIRALKP